MHWHEGPDHHCFCFLLCVFRVELVDEFEELLTHLFAEFELLPDHLTRSRVVLFVVVEIGVHK